MASSSVRKYFVITTAMSLVYLDMATAQIVKWNKENSLSCLLEGVDNLVLRANISRTGGGRFIATVANFEIKANDSTENECVVINLNNKCEKYYPSPKCYCEYNSTDKLVVVYNTTADSSFSGKSITVHVSCAEEENVTSDHLLIQSIIKTTPPILYLNDEIQSLSSQLLHSKLPAVIKFCCSDNTSNKFASGCQANMSRNYQPIDRIGRCVSYTEQSPKYSVYEMISTMCNKTLRKIDIIFFPPPEETNDIERESFSSIQLCFFDGFCSYIVVLLHIVVSVVIFILAMHPALIPTIWRLIKRKLWKNGFMRQIPGCMVICKKKDGQCWLWCLFSPMSSDELL